MEPTTQLPDRPFAQGVQGLSDATQAHRTSAYEQQEHCLVLLKLTRSRIERTRKALCPQGELQASSPGSPPASARPVA
jgi:hypothetical protein